MEKKPRQRGQLESSIFWKRVMETELIRLYEEHPPFKGALARFRERHASVISQMAEASQRGEGGTDRLGELTTWPLVPQSYREELLALCRHWGLRAGWAASELHQRMIGRSLGSPLGLAFVYRKPQSDPPQPPPRPNSTLSKAEFHRLLRQWGREAWAEHESALERELGFEHRDSRPNLARDVHWLFLRICPNEPGGTPRSYREIADTARKAVTRLAKELAISLPES